MVFKNYFSYPKIIIFFLIFSKLWKCIYFFNIFFISLNPNECLITDFEVKEILLQKISQRNRKDKKNDPSTWLTKEILRYFRDRQFDKYTSDQYISLFLE